MQMFNFFFFSWIIEYALNNNQDKDFFFFLKNKGF